MGGVKAAYKEMDEQFDAMTFVRRVRRITSTQAMDSSILRMLRMARQKDPKTFAFICINRERSLYHKGILPIEQLKSLNNINHE